MTLDTQHLNKNRQDLIQLDEIGLFGYGSLMAKSMSMYLR